MRSSGSELITGFKSELIFGIRIPPLLLQETVIRKLGSELSKSKAGSELF